MTVCLFTDANMRKNAYATAQAHQTLYFLPFEPTDNYVFIISEIRYFQSSRPSGGSFDIVEVVGSSPIDPTSTVGLVTRHQTIGKPDRFLLLLRGGYRARMGGSE